MRTTPFGDAGRRLVTRRVRFYHALIGLITVMFAAETVMHFTAGAASRWIVAGVALAAAGLAVGSGMTAADLGLARETLGRGLRWSAAIIAVVVVAIAAGLAIGPIRELFHNDAYRDLSWALLSAFVLIPWQTVVPEELLFRGVLLGALRRRHTERTAVIAQALLFGLWHVVSATGLSTGNRGIGDVVGAGPAGVVLGILGAVAFTTIAGLLFGWLRVRTGSLLPSIALHWAANGAGAVAAALAWKIG
ncbi:CPBP family intramembrane metalloprotease [Gordonia sp. PP30]|uniref:CPBP family intramembrane glutamic endopeptidase n=1 Tax=Gordonia sp. PP30 TaxID=2935861 RepID=UPI001FFF36A6|nr:CPBP family intramembrane glutamic endopeptidase [Gordonia sp. PP30]UQE74013.1 CPBP family intramembrane metalloprotease [Gordonia sp. PP30]